MKSNLEPSKKMLRFVDVIASSISGPVLDIPCGNGRNALPFADRGLKVFCLDKDESRLRDLRKLANSKKYAGRLVVIEQDLNDLSKRFYDKRFGAILNIHYVDLRLLSWWKEILLPGGYLYIETFANRGENYLELPLEGCVISLLKKDFDIIDVIENATGKSRGNRSTITLLAKKFFLNSFD